MTVRARLAAAALAAAGALAGCSGDGPRVGATEKVQTTVEALLAECAAKNGPAVFEMLAEDTRRRFLAAGGVLEGCNEVMRLVAPREAPGADLFAEARVGRVERFGDHATAVVESQGHRSELRLLDTGLEWFVSNPPLYDPVGVEPSS